MPITSRSYSALCCRLSKEGNTETKNVDWFDIWRVASEHYNGKCCHGDFHVLLRTDFCIPACSWTMETIQPTTFIPALLEISLWGTLVWRSLPEAFTKLRAPHSFKVKKVEYLPKRNNLHSFRKEH